MNPLHGTDGLQPMTEKKQSTLTMNRRNYLTAAVGAIGAAGGYSALVGAQEDSSTDQSSSDEDSTSAGEGSSQELHFVVEQGDKCIPLTKVSPKKNETVEEFYDYRTPDSDPSGSYGSSGSAAGLQQDDKSVIFLFDGADGLSLVMMHDKQGGSDSGGSVTFEFAGLPSDGEWAVKDDDYEGSTNYDTFETTKNGSTVNWTWGKGQSDGGAYRGLGKDTEIKLNPAFNEDAALYGEYYDGEITGWEALSTDSSELAWKSLDLNSPITIRAGTCSTDSEGGSEESDSSQEEDASSGSGQDTNKSEQDSDDQSDQDTSDQTDQSESDETSSGSNESDDCKQ
jgi:hypothetical protein